MIMHIDATDQDQQYCHVIDQEVRGEYYSSTPDGLAKDDGGTDADERSRREVINLQYEDRGMPIPYPEVRSALQDLSSWTARQKNIRRLMTHWSDLGLAHLPPEQREAQEREMASAYDTFDEKGLDAALASTGHETPAKVEPSDEKTLEEQKQIAMQVRRRLGMGQAAKGLGSHATKHRSGMQTGTEPCRYSVPLEPYRLARLYKLHEDCRLNPTRLAS
jgi:hypothetical protein